MNDGKYLVIPVDMITRYRNFFSAMEHERYTNIDDAIAAAIELSTAKRVTFPDHANLNAMLNINYDCMVVTSKGGAPGADSNFIVLLGKVYREVKDHD